MNVQKVNIFDDCVNQIQHLKRVYLDEVEAKERLADANQKLHLLHAHNDPGVVGRLQGGLLNQKRGCAICGGIK